MIDPLKDPTKKPAIPAPSMQRTAPAPIPNAEAAPPASPEKMQRMGLGGYPEREQRVDVDAARIMDKDSLLMQKARATGLQTANQRGLLNSSMAAQASQSAVLDQVVPMASQNVGQNFQRNMSEQDFQEQKGLAVQDADLRGQLMDKEFSFEAEQAGLERDLKLKLADLDISNESRKGAESLMNNAFNDYENSLSSILSNPNLPAGERVALINSSKALLAQKIDYMKNLYGTTYNWPQNVFAQNVAPAPAPAAAPPAAPAPAPAAAPKPAPEAGWSGSWNSPEARRIRAER